MQYILGDRAALCFPCPQLVMSIYQQSLEQPWGHRPGLGNVRNPRPLSSCGTGDQECRAQNNSAAAEAHGRVNAVSLMYVIVLSWGRQDACPKTSGIWKSAAWCRHHSPVTQ